MDAGNQQRILGYFIEEAKEHLDTLEKGLLDLRTVVQDPERVNEMFRAAHSLKGGAAMLGFASIQKTAHRFEDSFKILKENSIPVDQKLETLFLQGYDTLKDLIEQLQGPFGLREEDAEKKMQAAEPDFAKLQDYLNSLSQGGGASPPEAKKSGSLPPNFVPQVTEILRQMLQLFKQQDTPASRQQLQAMCKRLLQLGAGIKPWQSLIQISYKAMANPKNSYPALAPIVIKELKQASDKLQQGKANELTPTPQLQKLAMVAAATSSAPTPTPGKEKEKPPAATKATTTTPKQTTTTPKQITLPLEPKAAAKLLVKAFDKPQLVQLVKLLAQATRG
ncbi:Hpt domain-containing protein [Microcoleus sp. FACHB-53]|nr:Hpt domain-containing protein [Microcoleus sp. FACHB-53]